MIGKRSSFNTIRYSVDFPLGAATLISRNTSTESFLDPTEVLKEPFASV
jgi:hypothetical protein